jgi:hypothetical protein
MVRRGKRKSHADAGADLVYHHPPTKLFGKRALYSAMTREVFDLDIKGGTNAKLSVYHAEGCATFDLRRGIKLATYAYVARARNRDTAGWYFLLAQHRGFPSWAR